MKKYITIATLLVAGSAFASAAYYNASDYVDNLLWTLDTSNKAYAITLGEAFEGDYKPATNWGSQDFTTMPGYVYANGGNKIALEGASPGIGNMDQYSVVMNVNLTGNVSTNETDNTAYWLLSLNQNQASWFLGLQYDAAAKKYVIGNSNHTLTNIQSFGTHELSAAKEIIFTMSGSQDETGHITAYVNGVKVAQAEMAGGDRHGTSVYKNGVAFLNKMTEHDGVVGGLSSVSVYKTVISVIPEPSTFGLLAGLGALALVGTRRRRR